MAENVVPGYPRVRTIFGTTRPVSASEGSRDRPDHWASAISNYLAPNHGMRSPMPSIPLPLSSLVRAVLVLIGTLRQVHSVSSAGVAACVQAFPVRDWVPIDWPAALIPTGHRRAAVLPVLPRGFRGLRRGERRNPAALILHLIPAAFVLETVAVWRAPIDSVLFAIYLGYGAGLLRMARRGRDTLVATRLGDSATAHKALVAVALLLILTAFVDAGVSFALTFGNAGRRRRS